MVTVLVQRQQREAAQRKKRLLAARQAAAQLSVQQARSYKEQKRKQLEGVHEDARQLWLQSQQHNIHVIDALAQRGMAQQDDGQEAAADFQAEMQRTACEEASAWQAERKLEVARHRLAMAYTRAEAHECQRPLVAAQRRRAAVRAVEKQRAARVAAARPSTIPLAEVMRSLRAAPAATDSLTARIPVAYSLDNNARSGPSRANNINREELSGRSSSTLQRRWRMTGVAPNTKVTVHVSHAKAREGHGEHSNANEGNILETNVREVKNLAFCHGGGAADGECAGSEEHTGEKQHATHIYALECAAALAQREHTKLEGQQKSARRAAAVLRRQQDERTQVEAARQAQRARMAAIRELYRQPPEDKEGEVAAEKEKGGEGGAPGVKQVALDRGALSAHVDMDGCGVGDHSPSALESPPMQRATLHGLTRQQLAQKTYRESEEDFRATFINGPLVAVQAARPATRKAPLAELLRPAQVADLLYSFTDTHDADADAAALLRECVGTAPSPVRSGACSVTTRETVNVVPTTRVLPSAPLHMEPLLPSPSEAFETKNTLLDGGARSPFFSAASPGASLLQRFQNNSTQMSSTRNAKKATGGGRVPRVGCEDTDRSGATPQPFARETHIDVHRASSPSFSPHLYVRDAASPLQEQQQKQQQSSLRSSPPREITRQVGARAEETTMSPPTPAATAVAARGVPTDVLTHHLTPPPPTTEPLSSQAMSATNANTEEAVAQVMVVASTAPTPKELKEEKTEEMLITDVSRHSSAMVSAATTPQSSPPRFTKQHYPQQRQSASSLLSSSFSASSPLTATAETSRVSSLPYEQSEKAEMDSGSSMMDTSGFSASTANSSSSHHRPLPTMTAEQLKLALIRLRNRITTPLM